MTTTIPEQVPTRTAPLEPGTRSGTLHGTYERLPWCWRCGKARAAVLLGLSICVVCAGFVTPIRALRDGAR